MSEKYLKNVREIIKKCQKNKGFFKLRGATDVETKAILDQNNMWIQCIIQYNGCFHLKPFNFCFSQDLSFFCQNYFPDIF